MGIKKDECLFYEPDATEIIPHLFLGNYNSAQSIIFLKNNNIKTIIRVLEYNNKPRELKLHKYIKNGIKYNCIPIKDVDTCLVNLNNFFDMTGHIIKESLKINNNILVHCKRGHHRSGTVIAAFLIKYLNTDYMSTVLYINRLRKCALRRDTCMVRGLFIYYMSQFGIKCNKIVCSKCSSCKIYECTCEV